MLRNRPAPGIRGAARGEGTGGSSRWSWDGEPGAERV